MSSTMRRTLVMAVGAVVAITVALPASPAGATNWWGNRGRTMVVNTTADTADVRPGDGKCRDAKRRCSLRAAVQEANAKQGRDTIRLSPRRTHSLTLAGSGEDGAATGDLDLTDDVTIDGRGATIELGALGDRALDVADGVKAKVTALNIVNGTPPEGESGGAIRSAGRLELWWSTATNNVVEGAGASGGAVFNDGGDLAVVLSRLERNSATRAGGAVEADGGSTDIFLSRLTDNTTGPMPGNGGGLHLTGAGVVDVWGSVVDGNSAAAEGGGLWNSATGRMTVTLSTIEDNAALGEMADNGGGGLFNDGGELDVRSSRVGDNTATAGSGSGGGIFNAAGTLDVRHSVVDANAANRAGGGIETIDGTTSISRSDLRRNTTGDAPGNGGGLHVSGMAAEVSIDRTRVTDNVAAAEGGGLWAGAGSSTMTVTNSTIARNVANGTDAANGGGGLFNEGGLLAISRSKVTDNSATMGSGSGGGVLNLGTLEVSKSRISGNSAARAGGGIESNDVNGAGDATLDRVDLVDNTTGAAPGNGGGMHVTGPSITTVITESKVTGNAAANEGGGLWNFADATMTVTDTRVTANTAPVGPDVFQNGDGGDFTIDGTTVPAGDNALSFP